LASWSSPSLVDSETVLLVSKNVRAFGCLLGNHQQRQVGEIVVFSVTIRRSPCASLEDSLRRSERPTNGSDEGKISGDRTVFARRESFEFDWALIAQA
jgi:hypothetical protein